MKKREPPQIGDLVCLTYNTNTIGIVTDIWNCHNTKYRYKVKWLKDQENILSKQNLLLLCFQKFDYCDSVLLHLEEVC